MENQAQRFFSAGQHLQSLGRYEHAEQKYRQALQISPDDALTLGNMSICLLQLNRINEAIQASDQALRVSPDNASFLYSRSFIFLKNGQKNEAIELLKKSLAIEPEYSDALNQLSLIYYGQNQYELAEKMARQALSVEPNCVEAHIKLGTALWSQKRLDEARCILQNALKIEPENSDAHLILGRVLYDQNDIAAAHNSFLETLRLNPLDKMAQLSVTLDEIFYLIKQNSSSKPDKVMNIVWRVYLSKIGQKRLYQLAAGCALVCVSCVIIDSVFPPINRFTELLLGLGTLSSFGFSIFFLAAKPLVDLDALTPESANITLHTVRRELELPYDHVLLNDNLKRKS